MSTGRQGGYLYIDWAGRIMPCVFAPYAVADIREVYARGETLNHVWQAPFLSAIRDWQRKYGYAGGPVPTSAGDWLRPCPVRDHYPLFRGWLEKHRPAPQDETARRSLESNAYRDGLEACGDDGGLITMEKEPLSPRITSLSWGKIEVEGGKSFKDAKLYPGGASEWNWNETGTAHEPGIQPADVRELLDHGARVVVLSKGMEERLQVTPEAVQMLEDEGVEVHVLQTDEAVRLYNELGERRSVGGLFHSTC